MPLLKNVNPLGEVDLPLIGREGDNGEYSRGVNDDGDPVEVRTPVHGSGCLERDEVFEVDDETAAHLLEQVGNYELADGETWAPPVPDELADTDPADWQNPTTDDTDKDAQ